MSEADRSFALATACQDLQAQLEAGDRSLRHVDHDLTLLREALHAAVTHTATLTDLQQHLNELRGTMREQRSALREVRRAAAKLCATIAQARETMTMLADQKEALEQTHATLLADDARRRGTPRELPAHDTHDEPLGDQREFRTTESSVRDPKA
jgi:predicted  nucleic acid-binding Zn-ribbon protein